MQTRASPSRATDQVSRTRKGRRQVAAAPKGSINLRIEAATCQLIDEAAAILGKTRTEFMVELARRQALDVLLERRLFALESDDFDAFAQVLDKAPAPGPRLKSLANRTPAWQAEATSRDP